VTDDELIADFFETRPCSDGLELFVRKITWNGPRTPVSTWDKIATFPPSTEPEAIQQAMLRTLSKKKYFKACDECGERKPSGWLTGTTCHSCFERMGVRF